MLFHDDSDDEGDGDHHGGVDEGGKHIEGKEFPVGAVEGYEFSEHEGLLQNTSWANIVRLGGLYSVVWEKSCCFSVLGHGKRLKVVYFAENAKFKAEKSIWVLTR